MPTRNLYVKFVKKLKGKEPAIDILLLLLFLGTFVFIKELTGVAGKLWFTAFGLIMVSRMAVSMLNPDRDPVDKTQNESMAVFVMNMMIVMILSSWFIDK